MKLTVVVVDDELAPRESIKAILAQFEQVELLASFDNSDAALRFISQQRPDLAFLDVEMPGCDGLTLAKQLEQLNCQVVFVTGHREYALSAFDTHAIDYLLKPIQPEGVSRVINKLLFQQHSWGIKKSSTSQTLLIGDGNAEHIIGFDDITHIETIERYTQIHLTEQAKQQLSQSSILTSITLNEFEVLLMADHFFRIHRNCIANLHKVTKIKAQNGNYQLTVVGVELHLDVSRRRVSSLKQQLSTL
ncbi:MAG: two-component system LytT family response regulator [Phenylobacterium sp.]|jgi:two-component system LytT family response regulator